MNIFVDGYGIVAHSIVRKILENHSVDPKNLLINTYHTEGNTAFLNYLKDLQIKHFNLPYNKLAKKISLFKPDYFLSLYGRRIIPCSILNLVKFRSINLHPSLLPEYKGCFSCPWVIIQREKFTGITIHDIIEEVDAGEIFFRKLRGVTDPEEKRKVIGALFVEIFERESKKFTDVTWLAQGTIYPDIIDSAG